MPNSRDLAGPYRKEMMTWDTVEVQPILLGDRCYACSAGAGSRCGGALLSQIVTKGGYDSLTIPLSEEVPRAIQTLDCEPTHRTYWEQNECVFLEHFLPPEVVEHHLLPEVEQLRSEVHRNYIPKHKKGGSVSYYTLVEKAPVFLDLYRSPAFIDLIVGLSALR